MTATEAGVIDDSAVVTACAVAAAGADEAERLRRLPPATVDALVAAGLMRLGVPACYGGPGVDPLTMVDLLERAAVADGAAGWCAMIASTTSTLAAFLPSATAWEVYGDPGVVTGGVFAPNGRGVVDRSAETVRVSGRWAWGSGTQHCGWILGGVRCDDDRFRLCWFDAGQVVFHDTWHTVGLCGTGSLDFEVVDAIVPLARTVEPGVTPPAPDAPIGMMPNLALAACCVAAVSLGIARRAIAEVTELAGAKTPQYASRPLAHSGHTQVVLARAEAALRGGRALLDHELTVAWERARRGEAADVAARAALRLAGVHAVEQAVAATDSAYTLAGGTSVYSASVLQRCLRDVHVASQHIMVAPKLYETLGRIALGLDVDATNL